MEIVTIIFLIALGFGAGSQTEKAKQLSCPEGSKKVQFCSKAKK